MKYRTNASTFCSRMATLVEHLPSSLQAPDLFGTLREMAEFGPDAGKRLRAAREGLGLSQFEAAVKLEVTEKTVGKWERAQAKPTRKGHWAKIEEVYGVTRREILGEPEPDQLDRIEQMLQRLVDFISSQDEVAESEQSEFRPTLPTQRPKSQGTRAHRKSRKAS